MTLLFDQNVAWKLSMAEGIREAREAGREEGRDKALQTVALKLMRDKAALSAIADLCEISPDDLRKLAREHGIEI